MKRTSIRQALINAVESTDEGLSRYPNQMLKWAKYIEQEIGSKNAYKVKAAAQTVTGSYLLLPSDCYRVIGVFPGNFEDQANLQYRNIVFPLIRAEVIPDADVYGRDLTKLWLPAETTWVKEFFYEEIGDQLHMIQQFEGQVMTLVYNYIETDDQGFWIVNESHIDAITKFLIYKYADKFKWKIFKSDKLLRQGHIITQDYKTDYNIAVRNARAEDGKETTFEKDQY
jgi:hypothetical protein